MFAPIGVPLDQRSRNIEQPSGPKTSESAGGVGENPIFGTGGTAMSWRLPGST